MKDVYVPVVVSRKPVKTTPSRVALDMATLGALTVVAFIGLLLLVESVADTTRMIQILNGTFASGRTADYGGQNDVKIAPIRTTLNSTPQQ